MMPSLKKKRVQDYSTAVLLKRAKAYQSKRAVKGSIKARVRSKDELKYVDVAAANYVGDTTGSVTLLNGVAIGDDNNNREGRQINIKSVQVRGSCAQIDTSTFSTVVRMLLVWDNATNGTAPTIAQILTAATSASFPLVNNSHRFTILADQQFALGGISTTATQTYAGSPMILPVNIYKRLDEITQYSGTDATSASVQNGGLYMVTIGDNAAGAGAQFNVATRVRFTD